MKRTWRWLKIGLMALIAGGLVGGGIALYLNLQRTVGYYLKAGEGALEAGLTAFAAQRDADAVQRFHEAQLHAENALQLLAQTAETSPPQSAEEGQRHSRQEGLAWWLKYRAVRGRSWSQARSEGKTLPPHQAGETPAAYLARLTPNRLPDDASRKTAVASLREAAVRLPDLVAVQQEAVNFEMQLEPKQWPIAQIVASQLRALLPNDERALYLLARFEFEQPLLAVAAEGLPPGSPLPIHKRSRERMRQCLDYLKQLKNTPEGQRWRTLYLEAQARHWLVEQSRRPEQPRYEEEQRELAALRRLLFDDAAGLTARIARMDGQTPLSRLDTEGLLGLHALAVDVLVDDLRREGRRDPAAHSLARRRLTEIVRSQVTLSTRLAQSQPTPAQLEAVFEQLLASATRTQLLLSDNEAALWQEVMTTLSQLGETVASKGLAEPRLWVLLADLWSREAEYAGQRGQIALQAELRRQAVAWCERGLQLGQEKKLPSQALLAVHEAAGRIKLLTGAQREAVQPHVQALQASQMPVVQAAAALLEGALCEREGRLELARAAYERAAQLGQGTDLARRANTLLAPLCLTLNAPEAALRALRELEQLQARWATLTEQERAWLHGVVRSPHDIAFLSMLAHLQAAQQAWYRGQTSGNGVNPDQQRQLAARHEQEAQQLLAKLPPESPLTRAGRERWVEHLIQTQRLSLAEKLISQLKQQQPDNLAVLRLELQLAWASLNAGRGTGSLTPAQLSALDDRIRQFMSQHPQDTAARLLWAEWLLRTGRAAQAASFLDDPRHFSAGGTDARWQRVRLLVSLMQPEGSSVPAGLTPADWRDPQIDAQLVQTAASLEERQQLAPATTRHENLLLARLLQARQAEQRRDWAEAARLYAGLVEATALRAVVRPRLQNTLLAWAQQQPDACRNQITQLLQTAPAEPALLLGYAYCCFLLGDWGEAGDRGTQVNNLATALNAFEAAVVQSGGQPTLGPWTKAQLWAAAGRFETARRELQRLLSQQPRHDGALTLAIQIELQTADRAGLEKVRPWLVALREVQPQSPTPDLLAAQVAEKLGQFDVARKTYEQVARRFPKSAAAYACWVSVLLRQGDVPAALAVVKQWRSQLPSDLTAAQAEVRCLAQTGQLDQARMVREQILAAIQSTVLARKERTAEADWPNLMQSAEAEKHHAVVLLAQGLIQARAWKEAEAWLQVVLDTAPDHELAWLTLADLHLARLASGETIAERAAVAQQAQRILSRVYQQRPGHLVAGANLAWLYATELQNPEEALRLANEIRLNRFTRQPAPVESLPAELLDTYGQIYVQLNRPDLTSEWRRLFEAACQRYPQDPRMAAHLSRACRASGDSAAADAHAARARHLLDQPASPLTPDQKQRVLRLL